MRLFAALLALEALFDCAQGRQPSPDRLACQCFFLSYSLYISDADGHNEHSLVPDTGSNYNASFSADGRWIVFTSDRSGSADIYRVHPDGSGLEQLTHDPAFDDQGALSPDGKTLAFVSTRDGGMANIWLLDLKSGRARNLTSDHSGNFRPSWSPDGRWLAFSSDRNTPLVRYKRPGGGQAWEQMQLTAIYLIRRDGRGLRRLTPLDQIAGTPKWSRDGRRLIYYRISDIDERREERGGGHPRIMVMDLRSHEARVVSTGTAAVEVSPQYLSNTEIGYVSAMEENGSLKTRLSYSSGRLSEPRSFKSPSWSPDGSLVVYHRLEHPKHPWAQRLPTRDPRYELISGRPFESIEALAFTSGGDRFFYVSFAPEDGMARIRVGSLSGASTHTVFDTGAPKDRISALSLSPDEREFAIEIGRNMERPPLPGELAFLGTDGANFREAIRNGNSNGYPSYSPDGSRIVFRVLGSEPGLRILTLRDGKLQILTRQWDNFPTWSRQADRIAFTRLDNNAFEIYTIRPDGSDLRQLTHSGGTDAHPIWSPDGRWIAFESGRRGFKDESLFTEAAQPYGEVFVMRDDGSDVRQVTDNRYEEGILAWLPRAAASGSSTAVTGRNKR